MKNKKLVVFALSAIGLLGLAACDEIIAKPNDYDNNLVTVEGYTGEIYNNEISVVYDSIRSGNVGSDVLNELLYSYSITTFGYYNKSVSPAPAEGTITLEDAYKNIIENSADKSTAKAFIDAHKAYWSLDEDGNRLDDEAGEFARVTAKWNTIEERIAENLYDAIKGSTYIERNIFSELKFLRALHVAMENVPDPDAIGFDRTKLYEGILDPEIEAENVFIRTVGDKEEGFLHKEYYQSENFHYVEKKIIPTIYRQLLNEQYLLDETYNTLGRSYARKVNIIKIADNKDTPKASDYLMKQLIKELNQKPTAEALPSIDVLDTFKDYASIYVGSNLTQEQKDFINDTDLKEVFKDQGTYFTATEYGDLMEQYNKIYVAPILPGSEATFDTSAEDTFTDTNKYTKETGLELKTRELELKDYTTTGWFVKNGGLTDLPDAIRNRLFNIGVANGVKETAEAQNAEERWQKNANNEWEYKIPENESPYIARINGHNYLKTASSIDGSSRENDILHYDSSSSTYYVVEIEEAASSSKLSKKSANSYAVLRGNEAMEEIVNEVTKVVATAESYATLATKYFLEKMNIEYHDDVVYNYFEETYPELFED
ncbi:MAG: hypothetical protein J5880_01845 [Bacilli bacterium]|nr:hypothetical protein [Bacilli bacterium]